jgi:hypothetical protein
MSDAEHTYTALRGGRLLVWRKSRLWQLASALPVRKIPLQEFAAHLDGDAWFNAEAKPTTRNVLAHCRKIIAADLRFPIILDHEGRLMDGMHRIAKAWILGKKTINTVQFTTTPEPDRTEAP